MKHNYEEKKMIKNIFNICSEEKEKPSVAVQLKLIKPPKLYISFYYSGR
jgi:hypothetical protein